MARPPLWLEHRHGRFAVTGRTATVAGALLYTRLCLVIRAVRARLPAAKR